MSLASIIRSTEPRPASDRVFLEAERAFEHALQAEPAYRAGLARYHASMPGSSDEATALAEMADARERAIFVVAHHARRAAVSHKHASTPALRDAAWMVLGMGALAAIGIGASVVQTDYLGGAWCFLMALVCALLTVSVRNTTRLERAEAHDATPAADASQTIPSSSSKDATV